MSLYLGLDIASVDGNRGIDWRAVKAAGCRFVIIRGGFGDWADPAWAVEHERAQNAGLIVGAYLMPQYAKGGPSPAKQVDVFRRAVGAIGPGFFPPALDVEFSGGIAKTGRTRHDLLDLIVTFVADLKAAFGVSPMIYTSARVWDGDDTDTLNADVTDVDLSSLADCVPWIARYPVDYKLPAIGDDADEKAWVERLPMPPTPKLWGWIGCHQYQGDGRGFAKTVGQADTNRFFDLRPGSTGPGVAWLQRRLGVAECSSVFDDATGSALRELQVQRGLTADAIMGPASFSYAAWERP